MPWMPVPGIPTTILIAPDSFKGTFTARQVAGAIGRGLANARRPVDLCPVADGGEGTLAVLVDPLGAELRTVPARDPLGREIEGRFALSGKLAVVESAAVSGL